MSEEVLFNKGGIRVTSNRVVSADNTYAVRSIVSCSASRTEVDDSAGCLGTVALFVTVFILGFLVVMAGLKTLAPQWVAENDSAFGGLSVTAAVVIAIVSTMLMDINKTPQFNYHINISMANGHEAVLTSRNREDQREVLQAINAAIAAQR